MDDEKIQELIDNLREVTYLDQEEIDSVGNTTYIDKSTFEGYTPS